MAEKLKILSDAAKYDVSCSSGGSKRQNANKGLGNSEGMGICHSYTEDGRCVSLLKILLTNVCIYDCIYCVSRRSNDNKKTAFTVEEVVGLTINFYRRNYIEGLFLSSGIFKNADYTMERLIRIARELRTIHNFNGYIHLKAIPGASNELLYQAGLYADRLSINIELPSEKSLQLLAPEKNYAQVLQPMEYLKQEILNNREARKKHKIPVFAGGGQSTQMIVGASPESDFNILHLADNLYKTKSLKRIYYSAYIPVGNDARLPGSVNSLLRENRLYQADWLLREYGFTLSEIVSEKRNQLDKDIDPKLAYALHNLSIFPAEVNNIDYELLIRIPGIGLKSAVKIIKARKFGNLNFDQLKKIGISLNRAKYFITCSGKSMLKKELLPEAIKSRIISEETEFRNNRNQLALFNPTI